MVSPATVTTPLSGVSSRLMQRRNVLLPEPEEPRIEITSPSFAVRDTPRSTSSWPKLLCILSTMSAGVSADMVAPSARPWSEMRREAPFEREEASADDVVDDEIDRAGKDERQISDQRVVADLQRDAH